MRSADGAARRDGGHAIAHAKRKQQRRKLLFAAHGGVLGAVHGEERSNKFKAPARQTPSEYPDKDLTTSSG